MRNLLITSLLVLLPLFVFSQDKVSNYISNYQHTAISEMNRSGIPASITLAQGMFESAYGQSPSAVSYNNHFGIKCKKEWTGPYFYKHDDDRDKSGKLIPSCFRAYASVEESFQDHTNFLVERERYAELFSYSQTDYYNWAIGLERCGYATNKMYAERLIAIIERYSLHQYDNPQQALPVFTSTEVQEDSDSELIEVATDAFSDITSSSVVDQVVTVDLDENSIEAPQQEVSVIEVSPVPEEATADPIEEVTDAFANITSEDIDEILLAEFEKVTRVVAETEADVQFEEDNTNTLEVLEAFEEFTSVTPAIPATLSISNPADNAESASTSRVNRAVIIPSNYRRKADVSSRESTKLDKR